MSSLTYINPAGASQKLSDECHFSMAVLLPNGTVKCSGQGGWDPTTGSLDANDSAAQVAIAMKNVDLVLKAAGLRGWEDVYHLRSYHTDIRTSFDTLVEALKERIPGHRPCWTAVAVPHLAIPGMLIELEVEAVKQG
jgi:enamine deaminase RidA (YjgF/YER057c/UK114 family)